jgi:hypothetical protein
MTVAAGRHFDSQHFARAADRQRSHRQTLRQSARHDFGRVNGRVTKFCEQRQATDVILVAVAEHERVEWANSVDIRQET